MGQESQGQEADAESQEGEARQISRITPIKWGNVSFRQSLWRRKRSNSYQLTKGRRMKMKVCEKHDKSVIVFEEDACPLCKAEKGLKTIWAEMEKSLTILAELKKVAEEAGLK
jgi:protein-disulfide isomerase